ncbi:MAG: ChrR family anti-sigma-E factor [Boseongicola sp.]|nr:ChrR family anti-sigma-E factor [Boseongicola sp.]
MSASHHPSDELLLDYASGALGEAWSFAIATHIALCPTCRRTVARMEALGGVTLDASDAEPLAAGSFDAVLARLDTPLDENQPSTVEQALDDAPVLPQPLRHYLGADVDDLKWQRLGMGAYQLLIPTGEEGVTARLLRIPAGRPVPEHSHGGMELTLVLAGAFADTTGTYGRGDLQEADETLQHQPHAAPEEDCICLAITDAPLRFKSLPARLVQPFLGI